MACADTITNSFKAVESQFTKEVFRRTQRRSPIVDLMMQTRGEYPLGIGHTLTTLTTARNFPLDPIASRVAIAASNGSSVDACLPPVLTTKHGSIEYTSTPYHLAVNTPEFCSDDIKFDWQFEKQLENTTKQLTDITDHVLTEWFTNDYVNLSANHWVQNLAGPSAITSGNWTSSKWAASAPPTGYLSMGTLSSIYNAMYREGGDQPLARDMDDESPVFGLILGKEQADNLFLNNPTLAENIRWAWMGAKEESPLLPSGMSRKRRSFGGFIFYITPYPRRYNGAGVRIPAWVEQSANTGYKQVVNPGYAYASSEEVIPFNHSVYRSLAIPGLTNPAPGWRFDPQTSMGEFGIRNIPDKNCNPDGNKLFFRAIFRDAAEPLNPDLGYALLVKNCGYNQGAGTCAAGTSSTSA